MNTLRTLVLAFVLAALPLHARASTLTVSQPDTVYNWPGWSSPEYWNGVSVNSIDYIGVPDITSVSFQIQSDSLKSITLNMTISDPNDWAGGILPGDIFLNTNPGAGSNWTYVIHNPISLAPDNTLPGDQNSNLEWQVYKADIPYGNPSADSADYVLSTVYSDNLSNWIWRTGEPIQAQNASLGADTGITAELSSWPSQYNLSPGQYSVTWTLGGDGLDLNGITDFDYGFSVSCANDVVFGSVDPPSATPEPGTLLLLGLGAAGMVLMRARKAWRRTGPGLPAQPN